ncbi:bifunctional DNA primase/polymerase [Amycolatopsis anabasis]|uniref:bifunctional DNA primase/polymerase n=1 Tax=Amycolatopsis anabasis TaxID=1840409 RepID=UPI00131C4D76|nr:bifunctional DNA primase/polymerase [Amycolatopsis anabasis]
MRVTSTSRLIRVPHPGTARRDAALAAAARGWRVFPVTPYRKEPVPTDWESWATLDHDVIHREWTIRPYLNIGIACGPSGLLVVDLDDPDGEPFPPEWVQLGREHGIEIAHGRDVFALLAERAGEPEAFNTFEVTTPHGLHLYYQRPKGLSTATSVSKIAPFVDTRGSGGAALAPGSAQLVDGHEVLYSIAYDLPLAPAPSFVVAALTPTVPATPRIPAARAPSEARTRPYAQAALRDECHKVENARYRTRHTRLFAAAAAMGELIAAGWIDESEVVRALLDAARVHVGVKEFSDKERRDTIADGIKKGKHRRRQLPQR